MEAKHPRHARRSPLGRPALLSLLFGVALGCGADDGPPRTDETSDVAADAEVDAVADVATADDVGTDGGDVSVEDAAVADPDAPDTGPLDAAASDTDSPDTDAPDTDASDSGPLDADAAEDIVEMPTGAQTIAGRAYFFDLSDEFTIDHTRDVTGAVISFHEYPHVSTVADGDGSFAFDGLPTGVELTLRVEHPDYYPTMTRTFVLEDESAVDDVSFQVLSHALSNVAAGIVGATLSDPETCAMATTVTAISDNMDVIWAVGEPGATTTTAPAIDEEFGPVYFNTSVIPDPTLDATTTDGGVVVAGHLEGTYEWFAHKEGYAFHPLTMRCVPGWLTNASPPYGLIVATEPVE